LINNTYDDTEGGIQAVQPENPQNRMLDLLDQAYHVSDDFEQFDALMDSANRYMFEREALPVSIEDLPRFTELDPHFEKHIKRIEGLMQRRASGDQLGLSIGHHAQVIISQKGHILTANSQAKTLFGHMCEGRVSDLPLGVSGVNALCEFLQELTAGVEKLERIVFLRIDAAKPRSALGYCRAVKIDAQHMALHLSLSYFDWTPAILASLQEALGLTDSEGLVLQGILKGQTQKEIAATRGRSLDTVKSQVKAVLRKAGCPKMTDLSHLCTSIAYVIGLSESETPNTDASHIWITPRQNLHLLPVSNTRTLAYYDYGDPRGKPVVFFHGFFQGPFFLDQMKSGLLKEGLRLIAPSRPYFGYTSPPTSAKHYVATVQDDLDALFAHLKLGDDVTLVTHHGGANHGFRFAARRKNDVNGMVMVGARLPMTSEHIAQMSQQARTVSAASRHAPSVIKLLATLGMKVYKKKGMDEFLRTRYAPNAVDQACLETPVIKQKLCEGIYHFMQQGSDAFVHDGQAQMSDWTAELDRVDCPQNWVHGQHCHILNPSFLTKYIEMTPSRDLQILDQAGFNILYQYPGPVLAAVKKMAYLT
jgi:pimeloyl-ACP methyl ester carboxylesterase/DNA-binding CsgD family transcriptional regulator